MEIMYVQGIQWMSVIRSVPVFLKTFLPMHINHHIVTHRDPLCLFRNVSGSHENVMTDPLDGIHDRIHRDRIGDDAKRWRWR